MDKKNKAKNISISPHWITGCSLLLGILFIVISAAFDVHHIFKEILRDFGIAFIISFGLTVTVDGVLKKRHEQEIDELQEALLKNVFETIYKKHIPEELFSDFVHCLMMSHVLRDDYVIRYILSEYKGDLKPVPCQKYVKCTAQSSYKLKNLKNIPTLHEVTVSLEKPLDASLVPEVYVESVCINGKTLTSDEIKKSTSIDSNQVQFRYFVEIPGKGTISVETKSNLIKNSTDQEVWSSKLPSTGIRLVVTVPNHDYDVYAKANHTQQLKNFEKSDVTREWKLDASVFPHQSIAFWWRPLKGNKCVITDEATEKVSAQEVLTVKEASAIQKKVTEKKKTPLRAKTMQRRGH